MIKEIIKDQFILSQKSMPATQEDLHIVEDMLDTMLAHNDHCVGMAANMIGYQKSIIVFKDNEKNCVMMNPEIMKTSGKVYQTEEGCLSHDQTHITKRFEKIKVRYLDMNWKIKIKTYEGLTAQIIQHEIDHCHGILI